jgi:membrane-bound serine protease (ClpP class)
MHGMLAFLTGLCVAFGALLLVVAFSGMSFYGMSTELFFVAAGVVFALAVIAAVLLYKGLEANLNTVKTGREALIGATGVAVTDIKPNGEVRILGEFWQATTKEAPIVTGQTVQVLDMEGMFLVVKRAKEKA